MHKVRSLPFQGDIFFPYFHSAHDGTYYAPKTPSVYETYESTLALHDARMFNRVPQGVLTYPSFVGSEEIASTVRRKPLFNNVAHTRFYGFCYPFTYRYRRALSYYGDQWGYLMYAVFPSTGIVGLNPYVDIRQYDDAARRAWWTMQPRFEGEISMLNFLYELRDFRTIIKSMWKFDHIQIGQQLRELRDHLYGRYWHKIANKSLKVKDLLKFSKGQVSISTKALADYRLTDSFVVTPLLADLATLHKQLGDIVQAAQQEYLERGQNVQTTHYSESFVHTDNLVDESSPFFARGEYKKTVFTATMEYRYSYKMRSSWDAFTRYWGLQPSIETFWNGCPWTFLFDYFINVGEALHTMRQDPCTTLSYEQYCESFKTIHSSGRHTSGKQYYYASPALGRNHVIVVNRQDCSGKRGVPVSGYQGTTYVRNVRTPNKGAALPRLKLPSNGQLLNGLALVRNFL